MTDADNDEETEVSKMTEEEPVESSESWKLKGDEFYRSKLYSKAIEAYSNAITNQVEITANFYSNRAASYLMIGSYHEALKDCDTAVNIEPNNPKIYFRRATILKSLGRFDDSIKSLTDGLALDSTSATAKTELDSLNSLKKQIVGLHSQVSNRQYRVVLPEIDAVIRIAGSRVRELNLLKANVLIELQRAPEAYNLTNAMMREHGSNADSELIVLRSRCLYISGDLENAIKHLQQSLRLDPDCKSSKDFLKKVREIEEKKEAGNAAFKAGSYQMSIDLWTESINLDNQNKSVTTKYAKAYIRRADSYYSLGGKENLVKSINDYQKALEFQTDEKGTESLNSKMKKAKVAHKRSGKKDLYGILGISQGASDDDIKKAYRKAALRYHPDKQASKGDDEKALAEKMFREIGEAYEVLSDPEKKKKYDEGVDVEDLDRPGCGGHGGHSHGGHGHGGMPGGIDPNILFQMFMQQQMHGRG